ncbi:hypothetical protein CEXT_234921 [Caerostris extrusa]|uniref:Uncharacterized protein n=1 Tax=Caerostris extrusa TaxID=172846 RepID=A0AAV4N670_CAEEX|nr:hypothetical protein CEXT_234921 [Caerostris extrusa]
MEKHYPASHFFNHENALLSGGDRATVVTNGLNLETPSPLCLLFISMEAGGRMGTAQGGSSSAVSMLRLGSNGKMLARFL